MGKFLKSSVLLAIAVGGGAQLSLAANSLNSLYLGAEQLGKGNVGVASARGADALFYNPALVAPRMQDHTWEFVALSPTIVMSSKLPSTISDMQSDETSQLATSLRKMLGENRHFSLSNYTGYIRGNWSLGVIASGFLDFIPYKSSDASGLETVRLNAYQNAGLVGSYRMSFSFGLDVGIAPKFISRTQYHLEKNISQLSELKDLKITETSNSGSALGFNLGAAYKLPFKQVDSTVALAIDDVGDTTFKASKDVTADTPLDSLKQSINAGVSATYRLLYPLTVEANYRDILRHDELNGYKRMHGGIQYLLFDVIGLTGGLNQGYGTAGVFIEGKRQRFYVGSYTQEMGKSISDRPDGRFYLKYEAAF